MPLGIVVILAFGSAGAATAELECRVSQFTKTVDSAHTLVQTSSDGRFVGFARNSSTSVYQAFVVDTLEGSIQQITSHDKSSAPTDISIDGNLVLVKSRANLSGTNVDGNFELFQFEQGGGTYSSITETTNGNPFGGELSADEGRVLLYSSSDLTGENPLGSDQVFVFDRNANKLEQVTHLSERFLGLAFSEDFSTIFVASEDDPLGENKDGNGEVFELDSNGKVARQITNTTTGRNSSLRASASGKRLLFVTTSEEFTGNSLGLQVPVIYDLEMDTFEVLLPNGYSSLDLAMNGTGDKIAISLSCSVWFFDLRTQQGIELLPPENPFYCLNSADAMSYSGDQFFIRSFDDPLGTNPEHNTELFRALCYDWVFRDGFEDGTANAWN